MFLILFISSQLPLFFLIKPLWKMGLLFLLVLIVSSFVIQISLSDANEQFNLLKWGYQNNYFSIKFLNISEYDFLTKWNKEEQLQWIQAILRRERIHSGMLETVNDMRLGVIFRWNIFDFSYQTIFKSLYIVSKLYLVMNRSLLLIRTTKLEVLLNSLENLLKRLKYCKIKVNAAAIGLTITLNALSLLMRGAKTNLLAQACWGSDISGSWWQKLTIIKAFIIPMFNSSFIRADNLGTAMYTRGYKNSIKRTRYYQYKIRWWDVSLFLIVLTLIVILIIFLFFKSTFMLMFNITTITFIFDKYIF
ncbi:energy-coupling factor transporter transmembrane component T family protein [Spiroplasma endosymbiont of 'Nebria riversi']|uniref:energy-coupling factor transporter transmembrane component T family protein n=1 Tax=Spiroplasma endosymbiont of 'Nebria riversi' TaxID=2792084 RepID=UPI001C04BB20|nr:energy-coupling factor transporter transmembrane component T [Spiroplasma endosymbiont of 'Nebria riversi']